MKHVFTTFVSLFAVAAMASAEGRALECDAFDASYKFAKAWGGGAWKNIAAEASDLTADDYVWLVYEECEGKINFGLTYSEFVEFASWGSAAYKDAKVAVPEGSGVIGIKIDNSTAMVAGYKGNEEIKATKDSEGNYHPENIEAVYVGDVYGKHCLQVFLQNTDDQNERSIKVTGVFVGSESDYKAAAGIEEEPEVKPEAPANKPSGKVYVISGSATANNYDTDFRYNFGANLEMSPVEYVVECDLKLESETLEELPLDIVPDNGLPYGDGQLQAWGAGQLKATREWSHSSCTFSLKDEKYNEQKLIHIMVGLVDGKLYVDNFKITKKTADGEEVVAAIDFESGALTAGFELFGGWGEPTKTGAFEALGGNAVSNIKIIKDGVARTLTGAVAPEGYKGIVIINGVKKLQK